jgi:hypothetical protein
MHHATSTCHAHASRNVWAALWHVVESWAMRPGALALARGPTERARPSLRKEYHVGDEDLTCARASQGLSCVTHHGTTLGHATARCAHLRSGSTAREYVF